MTKIYYIVIVLILFIVTINANDKQTSRQYINSENIKYDEWKKLLQDMEKMKSLTAKDFLRYMNLKGLNPDDKEVIQKIKSLKIKLFNEFTKERIPENILEKIEDERAEKEQKYNFVEIEECTIPISKKYIEEQKGNTERYKYKYIYPKKLDFGKISVEKRFHDDYNVIMQAVKKNPSLEIKKKKRKNYFDITEIKSYNHNSKIYMLFGKKSIITFINRNTNELDYLLDYCQRTWKQNIYTVHSKSTSIPPAILYLAVEEKYVETALKISVFAPEGNFLQLSKSTSEALALESDKENLHLLKIDSAKMHQDGVIFKRDVEGEWFAYKIDAQYMTLII